MRAYFTSSAQPRASQTLVEGRLLRRSHLPGEDLECLPPLRAELLVTAIRAYGGARLAASGIVDLSDLLANSAGIIRIVLQAVQDMLLRLALQTACDDYDTCCDRQRQSIEIAKRASAQNRQ